MNTRPITADIVMREAGLIESEASPETADHCQPACANRSREWHSHRTGMHLATSNSRRRARIRLRASGISGSSEELVEQRPSQTHLRVMEMQVGCMPNSRV
jgi:hypothetical protein